jgi:hypothetical protein
MIQQIGGRAWQSYADGLKMKASPFERAMAEEIDNRATAMAQLSQASTLEAMINALKQVKEEMHALQDILRALRKQHGRFQPATKAPEWMRNPTLDTLPALAEAMKNEDNAIRGHAVVALAKIRDAAVIPLLVEALADKQKAVRFQAISALHQIGRSAVPALIEAVRQHNGRQSSYAVVALGKIGDSAAVPALVEALNDRSLIFNATVTLGKIGDAEAVPALIQLLRHERAEIRHNAAEALRQIDAPEAVSALQMFNP